MIKEDFRINIPNLISLTRLLSVPLTVWLIMNDDLLTCFWVFILAGISDAADGFIAKRYNLQTELGGYLDPIADKSLLVSVFVTLGYAGYLDFWLVLLVVFRDALILVGAFLYHLIYQNLHIKPLLISKINTTAQFILLTFVMGFHGYTIAQSVIIEVMVLIVAMTTVISGGAYVSIWGSRAAKLTSGE
jgi:cardiolipin synthase